MVYMANELAVKVKVNLDTNQQALQTEFQKVTAYSQKHPVTLSVKIDKNSLKKSIEDAFGKGATQSMTNAAAKVNDVSKQMNKLIGNMRELNKWEQKLESVQAKTGNHSAEIADLNHNISACKTNITAAESALKKLNVQYDKQDRYIETQQKLARSLKDVKGAAADTKQNKSNADEVKKQADALQNVITAQNKLTESRVKYNAAIKSGNADNRKLYSDEVTKNLTNLSNAKDAADKLGVSWRTDKEYLDAVHEGQTKVTESANTLAAAQAKTFDNSKATAIRNIVAAINEEAEATVKAYNAERTGNTPNKSLHENEANQANAKQLQLLADYQAKYHESALQNVDVNNALASSVSKTTAAYNDLQEAQGKTIAKDKAADIRKIVDAINAETDATLKSIEAEKQGDAANKALYDAETTKANLEQTKLMQSFIIKYNESAKQTVEVNEAIAEGVKKISVATNQVDFEKEKAAIKSLTDAVKAQTDAQIAYDKAKLSGKTETANAKYSDLQDAKAKTDAARQAANQLGISWLKNKKYIDAVNESQRKYNSEMNNFNASAIDKQRIADLNQIVKLINEEAAASAQAEKARQSGNANSANDAEQRSIKASNEAVRLMADYQNKYNQSAMQTKEVNDAITSGLQQMKTAQAGVADAQAKSDATDAAKAEKAAIDDIIDALEKRTKAQIDYKNALKSGDINSQQDASDRYAKQDDALRRAKDAADQAGIAWRNDARYLDALYESQEKVATSSAKLADAQSKDNVKEKTADIKQIVAAINEYAIANKNLIDAQRSGKQNDIDFFDTQSAEKYIAAYELMEKYQTKYGEDARNNIDVHNAIAAAVDKETLANNKYANAIADATQANDLARASMQDYTNRANTQIRSLTEDYGKFGISMTDVTQKYQAMEAEITKATQSGQEAEGLKKVTQCYQELGTAIAAATAEGQRYNNRLNNQEGFDNISTELDKFVNKNPNLSSNAELWKQIQNLDAAVKSYSGTLKENQAAMAHVKAQAEALGLTTETLGQKFTRLWKEHFQTAAVMAGIHLVQQGLQQVYQNVSEVDAAMTELKKVTDETDATYTNFLSGAGQSAKELGASISDIVNSTADFARLGYSLSDATELAKVATVYTHVGDDLSGIDEATESIISTMKAFNIEAKDSISIVDKFNGVSNNFAISAGGLGQALQRSASALHTAGNTLSESIGMIVAANDVTQDEESVGNALKVLSLRIRGAKTELKEMGEDTEDVATSTAKLRDSIKGLTGVDIMKSATEFKSTFDIMDELADKWSQLDDISKASTLEQLAGKNRANVVAGMLENWKDARDAAEEAENSAGAAMAEQEKWSQSIAGRLAELQASFQNLSGDLLDSDIVKVFINIGTAVTDVTDKVVNLTGVLPLLAGAFSTAFAVGGPKLTGSIVIVPTNTLMVTWNEQVA